MKCTKCNGELSHLHNEAHGIPGTHMDGSERYECQSCDWVVYAEEGESLGLRFVLDGKAKEVQK